MEVSKVKHKLPSLDDLYSDKGLAAKQNDLNILLNHEPKKDWIKENNGIKYIPVSIIEYLLTSIFIKWRVEIKETRVIANSVCVTVRLLVQDPVTFEWDYNDGVGAVPIQTKKGCGPSDFENIQFNSIMLAAPAAESYAIKDAAEKFGKLFGKDLNRKDILDYHNLDGKLDSEEIQASNDQYYELVQLMISSNLDHEEQDILREKMKGFISLFEFENIKKELISRQQDSEITRIRNGETLNQTQIGKAVKQAN